MRPEDYPPQEPFSDVARKYHDQVMALGADVIGEDVAYGEDPYQGIAIHRSASPDGTVLAFLHGGGWTNGYKEWMAFMAPAFTDAGVTFASVGYRLAPAHVFPAGFDDATRAVAWLHANVAGYGGDQARLFVGGHSAGGHYAALMAVRRDWQAALGLPGDAIRGCLPISGVYRFGDGSGLSARPRFLGSEPGEIAASPIENIQGMPPPFLLAYGTRDFPHLIAQATAMAKALEDAGGEVEEIDLADRTHFTASTAGGEPDGPWVPRALAWIRRH